MTITLPIRYKQTMMLRDWLKAVDKRPDDFASEISVKLPSLYRYMKGRRIPNRAVMARIREKTGGLVTAKDWFPDAA